MYLLDPTHGSSLPHEEDEFVAPVFKKEGGGEEGKGCCIKYTVFQTSFFKKNLNLWFFLPAYYLYSHHPEGGVWLLGSSLTKW